jgi:hypothetical protein
METEYGTVNGNAGQVGFMTFFYELFEFPNEHSPKDKLLCTCIGLLPETIYH